MIYLGIIVGCGILSCLLTIAYLSLRGYAFGEGVRRIDEHGITSSLSYRTFVLTFSIAGGIFCVLVYAIFNPLVTAGVF